ncbi:MAG: RNHCP domain-containing protein [Candidatus Taylorbacteria bacterium]
MQKRFTKRKEDFVCENCGEKVIGDGYTNHCPKCLWGKHVDVFPGDRMSSCKGLMKPVGITVKKGGAFVLVHECVVCKQRKNNVVSKNDNVDLALSIEERAKRQN